VHTYIKTRTHIGRNVKAKLEDHIQQIQSCKTQLEETENVVAIINKYTYTTNIDMYVGWQMGEGGEGGRDI